MKYWMKVTILMTSMTLLAVSCKGAMPRSVSQLSTDTTLTISTATPTPVPADTPTPLPTPLPAFARELAQVCQGQAVPAAAEYKKDAQIHPVLLLSPAGEWHAWNDQLPVTWQAHDVQQTELVGCVSAPYEVSIESCAYTGNLTVERLQSQVDIRLVTARSAETVATLTSIGDPPHECFMQTFAVGEHDRITGPEIIVQNVLSDLAPFTASARTPQILHGMHFAHVNRLNFSADGKTLETQDDQFLCNVVLWNLATGQGEINRKLTDLIWHKSNPVFSTDRSIFYSSGRVYDVLTETELQSISGEGWFQTFSPDNQKFATISADRLLQIFEIKTGALLFKLDGSSAGLIGCYFSPDSQKVILTYLDGTAELWDIATHTKQLVLESDAEYSKDQYILELAFSPTDSRVAISKINNQARLWDILTGELTDLIRHIHPVNSLAFSPDGKMLALGSEDGLITIWDTASQQLILTLKYKSSQVLPLLKNFGLDFRILTELVFSPDSKTLASSVEGDIILWDLSWLSYY